MFQHFFRLKTKSQLQQRGGSWVSGGGGDGDGGGPGWLAFIR